MKGVKIYLCQKYTGKMLKEIGSHFGIGESGVSQASRWIGIKISQDNKLVSIHKWPFPAISVSICGIACATYQMYASAQSLDFLDLAENSSFLDWKLTPVPITKRLIYGWA
jgi:hypothetical protein